MIRYSLKCDQNHEFESWFQSAEGYESLRSVGMVGCPACGSTNVDKALMAPQVTPARTKAAVAGKPAGPLTTPSDAREAALAELRRQVESNSEYVGMNFAAEARRIHRGTAPERSIYGQARPDEARQLIEDGVPVAPLPFVPKPNAN